MEMSNFAHHRWHRPQQPLNAVASPVPLERFAEQLPLPPDPDEQPGPDGIRWGLVNRIRAEIAMGIYDDDEKFAMATELMLQKIGR